MKERERAQKRWMAYWKHLLYNYIQIGIIWECFSKFWQADLFSFLNSNNNYIIFSLFSKKYLSSFDFLNIVLVLGSFFLFFSFGSLEETQTFCGIPMTNVSLHLHKLGSMGVCFTEPAPFFSFEFFLPSSSVRSWLCTVRSQFIRWLSHKDHYFWPSSNDHPIDIFFLLFASTVWHSFDTTTTTTRHKSKQTKSRHPRAWSSLYFCRKSTNIFLFSIFTHVDVVFRSQTVHLFCYLEQVFFSFEIVWVMTFFLARMRQLLDVCVCERLRIEEKK